MPQFAPELKVIAEVTNPWKVNFDPKWGGPENVVFNQLTGWSINSDNGIKYYSGTAKYQTTIDLSAQQAEGHTFIDLGNVQVIVRLEINGKNWEQYRNHFIEITLPN